MRIIISTILIIAIILSGVVFAIENAPDDIISSTIEDRGKVLNEEEVEDSVISPSNTTDFEVINSIESLDPIQDETIDFISQDEQDDIEIQDKQVEIERIENPQETQETITTKPVLKIDTDKINIGFTSSFFKIMVIIIAIIIILLLLLALSRKKDTTYIAHHNIKSDKNQKYDRSKDNILKDEINITAKEEAEIIIPAIESKAETIEGLSDMQDDVILNIDETEEATDLGLVDELSEGIEWILDNNIAKELETSEEVDFDEFDDIEDIDQLSKAIQDKEKELKKLEAEVKEIKEEEVEEELKVDIKKAVKPKVSVKDTKTTAKPKVSAKTKKTTAKPTKTVEKVTTKATKKTTTKPTKKTKTEAKETIDSAEDFLKNMEKSMKEDSKK